MHPSMLVHFPCLAPEARTEDRAPGLARAVFLDPGLRKDPDSAVFMVPQDLPMDRRQARAWLAQSLEYAGRFEHRGDLTAVSAAGVDDFYSGSSLDIQSRLRSMDGAAAVAPGPGDGEDAGLTARRRAQMVLLLAAGLQERLAEIAALDRRLGDAWQGLTDSLGLEEDDEGLPHVVDVNPGTSAAMSMSERLDEQGLSWPLLLESVFCFLPQDAALVVSDAALLEAWRDMGLAFSPMADAPSGPLEGMGPGALLGTHPGHAWCGRSSTPGDRPWLAMDRTVIHVPAHEGGDEAKELF